MVKNVFVRVNGRGNAWPVYLGGHNPFYANGVEDYANAAYSIIGTNSEAIRHETIKWEVLVDAGHGTIQYLLKNQNRIPEAIVLTHPHHDHTLSLDWIIQSYTKDKHLKYPVYATKACWNFVMRTYPQLKDLTEFRELKPGEVKEIKEVEGLNVTALPVFHGESAVGASMLCFAFHQNNHPVKIVFSGDVLCPLFREKDYGYIADAKALYVDTNNRFPYPRANHWSFVGNNPDKNEISEFLLRWKEKAYLSYLISPHLSTQFDETIHSYFDQFLNQNNSSFNIPLSIIDFLSFLSIENTLLVHYGGNEDSKYYGEDILTEQELKKWAVLQTEVYHVKTHVHVPQVGHVLKVFQDK